MAWSETKNRAKSSSIKQQINSLNKFGSVDRHFILKGKKNKDKSKQTKRATYDLGTIELFYRYGI